MKYCTVYSIIFFLSYVPSVNAQTAINLSTIEGLWQVVNSKGDPIHYVKIYEKEDKYYGKITKLFNKKNPQKLLCSQCDDEQKNKPVIGLRIIDNMERGRTKYAKGRILDYQKGRSSPCTIWMVNEDVIKVRSWWLFLYKTTVWYRISWIRYTSIFEFVVYHAYKKEET